MLLFCPSCSNMLIITKIPEHDPSDDRGLNRFECRTCPYQMVLDRRYYDRKEFDSNAAGEALDVMGGSKSWENVDRTWVRCVRDGCEGNEAFFRQVQIRSADEPMTSFYKCTKCGAEWREN